MISPPVYSGMREDNGTPVIFRNGELFTPNLSLAVRNHSPTGFEWSYQGSGPAQLALAILIDCLGVYWAENVYQAFKRDVIAKLPKHEEWSLQWFDISGWFTRHLAETLNSL